MRKICKPCAGYDFVELPKCEYHVIYPLTLALNHHCCESPFFMNRKPKTHEEFSAASVQEDSRYFAAKQNENVCAFLEISSFGETFAAIGNSYRHINSAYCLPQYRGKGVYQNLLNFTISTLKQEGTTQLGVDFESFNLSACGFWLKYFIAYTHGVVRRIDEHIMRLSI